tara:strand:+ start:182 stop:643 length:462 start_codon:yes stop_codon:yes gene_type:complete
MTHVPVETLLTGGNVNQVVKVGDTVRRLRGPHSKTVHEFLHHLETTCVQIPKLLGILRQTSGRDLISLIKTHLISNFGETAILAILTHAEAAAPIFTLNGRQALRKGERSEGKVISCFFSWISGKISSRFVAPQGLFERRTCDSGQTSYSGKS